MHVQPCKEQPTYTHIHTQLNKHYKGICDILINLLYSDTFNYIKDSTFNCAVPELTGATTGVVSIHNVINTDFHT